MAIFHSFFFIFRGITFYEKIMKSVKWPTLLSPQNQSFRLNAQLFDIKLVVPLPQTSHHHQIACIMHAAFFLLLLAGSTVGRPQSEGFDPFAMIGAVLGGGNPPSPEILSQLFAAVLSSSGGGMPQLPQLPLMDIAKDYRAQFDTACNGNPPSICECDHDFAAQIRPPISNCMLFMACMPKNCKCNEDDADFVDLPEVEDMLPPPLAQLMTGIRDDPAGMIPPILQKPIEDHFKKVGLNFFLS